jgi:phosphoribosylanthranilate isomerase
MLSAFACHPMIEGIRLKVCGITSIDDAELAARSGADCLGFILHPKSPRYVSLAQFRTMAALLPGRRKVAVCVEPTDEELGAMRQAGFDYFQIHFRVETPAERLAGWSRLVGEQHLWLAPKLPPETDVSPMVRAAARFVVLDTFHQGFGGSGLPGDWAKFARHQAAHPGNDWILAGGLSPENIGEAIGHSGARFVDVNSGVESVPGVKDAAKLGAFVVTLHEAAVKRAPPP